MKSFFITLFTLTFFIGHAQISDDSIRVSLVTAGPGNQIWQLEGHAALRVMIGENTDLAINYGTFDFNAPNFVYRFVKGETDYRCTAYPFVYFIDEYVRTGRWIHEYPIILSQDEAQSLVENLSNNLLPQNATYRYNYVKDNCATRPWHIIEQAIGDTLTINSNPSPSDTTYRQVMRTHHQNYPWYQFGIDLALGSGIDYNITPREKLFAPTQLDTIISTATRIDGSPITSGKIELYHPIATSPVAPPTQWPLTPFAISIYILIATIVITGFDIKRCRITRGFDAIFMTVIGLIGVLITYLVFISVHEATSPNWLLLWLNPLALLVPILIFIKKANRLLLYYEFVNFVAITILSISWIWLGQSGNIAFVPILISDVLLSVRYIYIQLKCNEKAN